MYKKYSKCRKIDQEEEETQEEWSPSNEAQNGLLQALRQGFLAAADTYPRSCEECTRKMGLQGVLAAANTDPRSCELYWAATMSENLVTLPSSQFDYGFFP